MRKFLPILIALIALASVSATAFAADATPAVPGGVININTADAGQIAMLPRVGLKAAQRVVDYRNQHGAFKKTTDLMQVKGFGEKTFERLNAYLTVEGKSTLTAKIHSPRKPRSAKASKSRPSTAS